ncbi:hypothetical protein [Citricoccus sp. GCM10030269]|uniref:hypothetical protein n=1 Tax=Citricoccus sp. GCM10030269 TaxID=3273388 RepID=UPI00360B4F93
MLYLITPDGIVSTLDAQLGEVLVDAQRGRPIIDQAWEADTAGVSPETVLTVALRKGIDAEVGLMVHGGFVDQVLESERLRAAERNHQRVAAQLESVAVTPQDEYRDWYRRQRAITEEARQSAVERMRKAEETAQELLDAPVDGRLARAWERAGGLLPTG